MELRITSPSKLKIIYSSSLFLRKITRTIRKLKKDFVSINNFELYTFYDEAGS